MQSYRILIVEDEILIADTLQRYIERKGWEVVGIAHSYEEAETLYSQQEPDLVLLDVRLNGSGSGIDVARFIQEQDSPAPFIFLTSQYDSRTIDQAKKTYPAGFLAKPIRSSNLFATIEIALHSHDREADSCRTIQLNDGSYKQNIPVDNIVSLEADHIYVQVKVEGGNSVLQRSSLRDMLDQLPRHQFIQTHRSHAINVNHVSHWDNHHIYLDNQVIPISRHRRKAVYNRLNATG
ncbi:MAG: response regulator [Bacteroidota bacterium]